MASIIVSGDTSGAVTLAAPAVAGTTTLTLPTTTGTLVVTSGAQTIEFADGTVSAPSITNSGDTNTGIFFPAADTIAFTEGGVESMRIDSSGNVGIGTSSPNTTAAGRVVLDINGSSNALFNLSSGGSRRATFYADSTDSIIGTVPAIPLEFITGGVERMRIDTSGNLCVGTTATIASCRQTVSFTANTANGIDVSDSTNTSGATFCVFSNGASTIGSIGRVSATSAVAYNTSSDQRLKSNIVDAEPVLDKLMDVKVRQFDWTDGNLHQDAGFIAQELAPVLSGIVTEGKTEEDIWQLDYSRLTPYLVKAIQELNAKVDTQTTKIAELEAKLEGTE